MKRLATLLIALSGSPALIGVANAGGSDSAPGSSAMPIAMCHQYCAFANAQQTRLAQRRAPRAPAAQAGRAG